MAMEDALIARFKADATIYGMTGDQISRFGFQRGETGARLAIHNITPGEQWDHAGVTALGQPRMQIDCRAEDADAVVSLARAVIAEMHEAASVSGTEFDPAMLEREIYEDLGEQAGGASLYQASLDFIFYHAT